MIREFDLIRLRVREKKGWEPQSRAIFHYVDPHSSVTDYLNGP